MKNQKTAGKTASKKVAVKKTAGKKATAKKATAKKDEKPVAVKVKDEKVVEKKVETTKKVDEKQEQNRDTKQFVFNGEKMGKGPFVLAAVRHYVKHHPKATLADMKKAFPDSLISRYGVFTDLKTALEKSKTSGKKRYFVNDDQTFEIGKTKYAVTNQITAAIMEKFLAHLKEMGVKQK